MNRKKIITIVVAVLIIIQFFQIEKKGSEYDSSIDFLVQENASASIKNMFNEACYDCHSNQTAFPWYTYIQPLGWWINGHIKGGKNKANYHNYGTLDKRAKNHLIEETIEVLENKRMPLKSYTWLHPKAKLSDADKTNMINWLNSLVEE